MFVFSRHLIFNLTYFGDLDLDLDLDMRSNFEIDLTSSNQLCFELPVRETLDGAKIITPSVFGNKLLNKKSFAKKVIWHSMTSGVWSLQFWSDLKLEGMEAVEYFKSFLMLFQFPSSYHSSQKNPGFLKKSEYCKLDLIWPHLILKILTQGDTIFTEMSPQQTLSTLQVLVTYLPWGLRS